MTERAMNAIDHLDAMGADLVDQLSREGGYTTEALRVARGALWKAYELGRDTSSPVVGPPEASGAVLAVTRRRTRTPRTLLDDNPSD